MNKKKKFVYDFNNKLSLNLKKVNCSVLIILCIGTNKVAGDAFGPLVGYKLKETLKDNKKIQVLGNLEQTICFKNINNTIEYINKNYKNPFIISIDSAISSKEKIGNIFVSSNGIIAGSGLNKNTQYIGNMSIKAVVAENTNKPKHNFILLQNTSINMVMEMANIVAEGMCEVLN